MNIKMETPGTKKKNLTAYRNHKILNQKKKTNLNFNIQKFHA
jgi:hypothetical protein